jgi:ABC-type oligopeptide transport system substrate-binding subunit
MKSSLIRWCAVALPLVLAGVLVAQDPPGSPPARKPVPKEDDDTGKPKKPIPKEDDDTGKSKKPIPKEDDDTGKKKPVPKEDDDSTTKPKKPVPKEDDDTGKKKPVPKEDDDSGKPKKPVPREDASSKRTKAGGPVDLAKEAETALNPEVKKLYRAVSVQADWIQLKSGGDLIRVDPLPVYIGSRANTSDVSYRPLGPTGKPGDASFSVHPGAIVRGVTYEERALDETSSFLIDMEQIAEGNAKYLPKHECLEVADTVLSSALEFLDHGRKAKNGPGWDGLRGRLMTKYLEVLTDELNENINLPATSKGAADRAADVADRMITLFPDNLQAQREFVIWQLSLVDNDLSKLDSEYIKAYAKLRDLEVKYPTADPKVLEKLRDKLRRRAQAHFDEARRLAATEDGKPAAMRQGKMGLDIWPTTPGLNDFQQQLMHEYQLLVVGVRQLPELMSPALAVTDADRWAVDLLFESLVKPVPDGQVGHRYYAGLAKFLPRTILMGREFELPRDAVWVGMDGKTEKVVSFDVRGTLNMLQKNSGLPVSENLDLLSEAVIQDSYRFPLHFERGCLDPLSAMTFKILPARMLESKPEGMLNRDFAISPVGSGPFVYRGRRVEDGREYSIFKANPQYGKRDGRFGLPRIQEIRFVVPPADPVADLREGRIDLMLDVPTAEMVRLRDPNNRLAMATSDFTLNTRRIWMIAVNHRLPNLGKSESAVHLRQALSYGIDRASILNAVFKAGTQNHREMNGPFPPDTWAAAAVTPKTSLFRSLTATAQLAQVADKPDQLTLKYVNDPLSTKACEMIKKQLAAVGINIALAPMSVADFHRDIMLEHNFELAYMPYDYASDLYSLRGLFDNKATGRGERNFMEYHPDPRISQLLSILDQTRDFDKIRDMTQQIAEHFTSETPFIPMWQLDFHMVVSKKLETMPPAAELDPHSIFEAVEEWRLNR